MDEDKEKALQELSDISQEFQKVYKQREEENDAWWKSLTEKEREDAFYAVCKRIHKGDLVDNGSYRYVLYDTFGFDHGMYVDGMNCGYMAIHNAIFDGEELQRMKRVTRFEVIDEKGRSYVKYLDKDEGIKYTLQDEDKTLKVFIDKKAWKEDL
jgi:hypothetical protein